MSDYVTPTITCGNFTKGKHYKIAAEILNGRVLIEDDAGQMAVVRIDGKPSSKLDYNGKFHRVSFESSPIPFVLRDGRLYINKAKIAETVIHNAVVKNSDWQNSRLVFQHNGKQHDALALLERNEQLERNINELIAANEEVRKILRCPDGFDIRKQAQVVRTLADTLLAISK